MAQKSGDNRANNTGTHKPWLVSLFIHGFLLALLLPQLPKMAHSYKHQRDKGVNGSKPEIQAKAVNENEVKQEIEHIKHKQHQKQRQRQQWVKRMEVKAKKAQQQARFATQKRKQQQRQLQQLKQDLAKLKNNKQAYHKRLAQKQKRKQKLEKQLHALVSERQSMQNKLSAMQRKLNNVEQKHLNQTKKLNKLQEKVKHAKKQQALHELEKEIRVEQRKIKQASAVKKKIDEYRARIIASISRHWLVPDSAHENESAQLGLKLAPNGELLQIKVVQSSGNQQLDRSAMSAVRKASPLPVPHDPQLFDEFSNIHVTVRPKDVHGSQPR
jgi:colicin import membrane protein